MSTGEFNAGGNPTMDLLPVQRWREYKYSLSLCATEIEDKRRPDGPLGLYAHFALLRLCMFLWLFLCTGENWS